MVDMGTEIKINISNIFEEALDHHKNDRLDQAELLYKHILDATPEHADAMHLYGMIAHQQGNADLAVHRITQAIRINPQAAHYHCNLGNALRDLGRIEQAIEHMQIARSIQPNNADIAANFGTVEMDRGELDTAILLYRSALSLRPEGTNIRYNLANALSRRGTWDEAASCYRFCLHKMPEFVDCHFNYAHLLARIGQDDAAMASYRTVLQLQPARLDAYLNLGALLHQQNRFQEAIACYQQALQITSTVTPQSPDLRNALVANIGVSLASMGRHRDAISIFTQALSVDPGNTRYRWDRAMSCLALEDFTAGWPDFAARLEHIHPTGTHSHLPQWHGQDISNQTLLILAEQGAGDMIWAARYLRQAKQACGTLIVQCPPALQMLFADLHIADHVIPTGTNLPQADWQSPIGSLPGLFVAQSHDIDGKAYLKSNDERIEKIRSLLEPDKSRTRIGVVWSGNTSFPGNANRRAQHFHFLEHFSLPSAQLYSLQKGEPANELAEPDRRLNQIIDLGPCLGDFADTAAAIMQMDLIITVDTAVAHLAGALGKPVWLMLGIAPSWLWMTERADCPWYDSMRVFRRTLASSWEDVFSQAAVALRQRLDG